jgi:hypothetical protein
LCGTFLALVRALPSARRAGTDGQNATVTLCRAAVDDVIVGAPGTARLAAPAAGARPAGTDDHNTNNQTVQRCRCVRDLGVRLLPSVVRPDAVFGPERLPAPFSRARTSLRRTRADS